jgi:hypothetical protein
MVPCKARAIGLGGATVGSLVWGVATQPIKKQRGGRGLGLFGGHRSKIQRHNQPRVRVGNRLEAGEDARWSGNAGLDVMASFGAANYELCDKKIKNKIRRGLKWLPNDR